MPGWLRRAAPSPFAELAKGRGGPKQGGTVKGAAGSGCCAEAVAPHRDSAGLAADTFSAGYQQAGVSLVYFLRPVGAEFPKTGTKGGGGSAAATVKWVLIAKHSISGTR